MKKFVFGAIMGLVVGLATSGVFIWQSGLLEPEVEMIGVEIHDTIYKDTLTLRVPVKELAFYNEKWVRNLFETTDYERWENYDDGYEIMYPRFMERKDLKNPNGRKIELEFHGIKMVSCAYDDKSGMSFQEKYEALSASAVTKTVKDKSFTIAGNCGDFRLYFEKDIMLKPRTWMYLRVEFPSELTWAVDPLLHYVKDYEP